ncbi:hypothetical protein [Haloglomus halophilum]|uniref:hypothetical protein n=1 Tax=Haloglomus halophilum TaxID=2962672 RepID=UPI0020C9BD25|nr:hypothetical protein [Haloglomus halophilum]
MATHSTHPHDEDRITELIERSEFVEVSSRGRLDGKAVLLEDTDYGLVTPYFADDETADEFGDLIRESDICTHSREDPAVEVRDISEIKKGIVDAFISSAGLDVADVQTVVYCHKCEQIIRKIKQ